MAPIVAFFGLGVAAGVAHFAALARDAHLLIRGGPAVAAIGLKMGRLTLTVAVLIAAAREGGPMLLSTASGLLIGRQLMLRQLGPRS